MDTISSKMTFSDFPEDVQLCILSFLPPADISAFACTSKRYASLCHLDSGLWYALCDRRWGSHTDLKKWADGRLSSFKFLYKSLFDFDRVIGFWRRTGTTASTSSKVTVNIIDHLNTGEGDGVGKIVGNAPLVLFEWGVSCVTGSRVLPCTDGSYNVIKAPFIWLSLSADGQPVNYLKVSDNNNNEGLMSDEVISRNEMDLVRINVSFMGDGHLVLEECWNGNGGSPGNRRNGSYGSLSEGVEAGSPPDRVTSEMYRYFANRTSPGAGGERAWRRQRRREKERQGRRKWDPEHLVKIVHSSPSPSRPLQGLWKGIWDDTSLDFFLVAYDDLGGVACRSVGDISKPFAGYAPVFWTSNATFMDSPLSPEEDYLFNTRMHLRPTAEAEDDIYEHSPSRIMYINSSYDLVLPDLAGTAANARQVEGRIWQYADGTFGFGFLRNNFIVDLKHIAQNGRLLDIVELCSG